MLLSTFSRHQPLFKGVIPLASLGSTLLSYSSSLTPFLSGSPFLTFSTTTSNSVSPFKRRWHGPGDDSNIWKRSMPKPIAPESTSNQDEWPAREFKQQDYRRRGETRKVFEAVDNPDALTEQIDKIRKMASEDRWMEFEKAVAELDPLVIANNAPLLRVLLKAYGRQGRMDLILRCLRDLDRLKCLPNNVETYHAILNFFVHRSQMLDAHKYIATIISYGVKPSYGMYNSMIYGHTKAKDEAGAESVIRMMRDANMTVEITVAKMLMILYSRLGKWHKAWDLIHAVKETKTLEVELFDAFLHGLAAGNQRKRVEKDEQMRAETTKILDFIHEHKITPTIKTYTLAIYVYGQHSGLDKALEIFADLKKSPLQPNVVTYTAILAGYAREERWEELETLFQEMLSDGIQPYRRTFHLIMEQCGMTKNSVVARQWMDRMKEFEVEPDLSTYTLMIKVYGMANEPSNAEEIVKLMEERGIYPDAVFFKTLLLMYWIHKEYGMAFDVLSQMEKLGVPPGSRISGTLLRSFCLAKEYPAIDKLLKYLELTKLPVTTYFLRMLGEIYRKMGMTQEWAEAQKQLQNYVGQSPKEPRSIWTWKKGDLWPDNEQILQNPLSVFSRHNFTERYKAQKRAGDPYNPDTSSPRSSVSFTSPSSTFLPPDSLMDTY